MDDGWCAITIPTTSTTEMNVAMQGNPRKITRALSSLCIPLVCRYRSLVLQVQCHTGAHRPLPGLRKWIRVEHVHQWFPLVHIALLGYGTQKLDLAWSKLS